MATCVGLSTKQFTSLNTSEKWYCPFCVPPLPPFEQLAQDKNANWQGKPLDIFHEELNTAYAEVITWKKNFFMLPRGESGKEFINEVTRLINLFNENSNFSQQALDAVTVMIPMCLQKPSKESKTSDHKKYLKKRVNWWKEGKIMDILSECREIQKRLISTKKKDDPDHALKIFTKLMFEGKVSSALKWLSDKAKCGILDGSNRMVIAELKKKHPESKPCHPEFLLPASNHKVEDVIYDEISATVIQKITQNMNGSGGPTLVDADVWRRMCSKLFGASSDGLCQAIALVARKLYTDLVDPICLRKFVACRLVPLDKDSESEQLEIRPIGIGETLRRIVGKAVTSVLKNDITNVAGDLQVCSGQPGGTEAAVHAMKAIYDDVDTECILLVDAENAFNAMNRQLALRNMQSICPELSKYLINTYREAPQLVINNSGGKQYHQKKESPKEIHKE